MFCSKCGYSLIGSEEFCPQCGSKLESNPYSSVEKTDSVNYYNNTELEKDNLATNIMVWGILSVAFAEFGLLGLIFACITNSKVKRYTELYGLPTKKAKIGKYLALGGLIGGIVFTVFWSIYFLIFLFYFLAVFGLAFSESMLYI